MHILTYYHYTENIKLTAQGLVRAHKKRPCSFNRTPALKCGGVRLKTREHLGDGEDLVKEDATESHSHFRSQTPCGVTLVSKLRGRVKTHC